MIPLKVASDLMKGGHYTMLSIQGTFAALAALNAQAAYAQSRWDNSYWGPGMMGWGMMGWIGGIMMVVFWAVIVAAIVVFIRWLISSERSKQSLQQKSESAMDILKKRYAIGEINKEEFEEKKRDLS